MNQIYSYPIMPSSIANVLSITHLNEYLDAPSLFNFYKKGIFDNNLNLLEDLNFIVSLMFISVDGKIQLPFTVDLTFL